MSTIDQEKIRESPQPKTDVLANQPRRQPKKYKYKFSLTRRIPRIFPDILVSPRPFADHLFELPDESRFSDFPEKHWQPHICV